jgi:predicted anti-sigma-YlaC factor YlaD
MRASDWIAGGRCLRARRSVSAAIDQEAAAGELRKAALHLARCSECRRFFVRIDEVSRLLRATEFAPRNGSGRP